MHTTNTHTHTHTYTHARTHAQSVNPTGQPPRDIFWEMLMQAVL